MVTTDNTKFLQAAHAPKARRCGNAYASGKFHIRHTPINLKFGDNQPVNGIKVSGGQSVRCVHVIPTYMAGKAVRKDGKCR
ncbi:hypothetical protein AA106555_0871 [Neokomagataea thailandica NBRC 106555]|uniref:Transposase n=1 Tax=Neokomagataea thailandica NBRC 106555 TaxID=1223520 RepID=A0ABQ0QPC3_9PROT|nr:hypothetical protein AA106555_0871 [Neokomagataea thailandica NBRC 106555]